MMSGPPPRYRKHVYWLSPDEEKRLQESLHSRRIRFSRARGVVCTPLDPRNRISIVAPEVWRTTCARQGSWYRTSDKKGLTLVVSTFELDEFPHRRRAVITESDFVPPRVATPGDKAALLQENALRARLPKEWASPGEAEKKIYLSWARKMGSAVTDYEFLHATHTANHGNFIRPRLFVTSEGGATIPYSIDRTAHLCSSCVELFQVLGEEFLRKLVAPCPGAVLFARLAPDRHLLVETV